MGREGDWECSSCGNKNYAFRCFCNRCKQPRLLVDNKTPHDSKWFPRIGDWICTEFVAFEPKVFESSLSTCGGKVCIQCTFPDLSCEISVDMWLFTKYSGGCTNNNYASREKCKKCGQPKEVAAMPAIAIPGASLPSHPNYFARTQGGMEQRLKIGFLGHGALQQLPLSSNWSLGEAGQYQSQPADRYRSSQTPGVPYASQTNQSLPVPNGWRNGDWLCSCGFHNYSSRAQCKKCNASAPPASSSSLATTPITALGTKRLASEELVHDWDNKRSNAGHTFGYQQGYPGAEWMGDSGGNQLTAIPTIFLNENSMVLPLQANMQIPRVPAAPTLLGKGAKQWRDGDWMCTNCSNHNYASRSNCNRCKSERDVPTQPVTVA